MRRDESFVKKMAIGCGITFVPILNIFAFGFLFQVAKQARRGEKMTVPEWRQWDALFVDGIRFLIVLTAYFVMPLAVGWLLINILSVLSLGIPLNVAYLPFSIALLLAPAFTCVGLTRFLDTDDWLALFEFKEIVSNVVSAREILFVPSLIFAAMQFFLFPLYGISFFLGFLFILPYYTAYISKKR
ncbi:MAG: hypothetical protein A2007_01070 [Verrucomicrobia bacterium GWC2_42_7]|nr:MAG: hypothetical protein A2007_01070 [Verrucomicrobia bacterium GWC2_42_7]